MQEGEPIDKEASFLRPYLKGWDVHDPVTGQALHEPKAPVDIPLLEEDFAACSANGRQGDHDSKWWGVRLTNFDEDGGGGGGGIPKVRNGEKGEMRKN